MLDLAQIKSLQENWGVVDEVGQRVEERERGDWIVTGKRGDGMEYYINRNGGVEHDRQLVSGWSTFEDALAELLRRSPFFKDKLDVQRRNGCLSGRF